MPEPPLPGATPAANNPPSAPDNGDAIQYLQKTADGHLLLEVTDLLFAADDDALRPALAGQTAEMIGQFMPAKDDASGRRFQLVRMFMVCCAADARPVAVAVEKPADPKMRAETDKLSELGWVRVTGKVDFPLETAAAWPCCTPRRSRRPTRRARRCCIEERPAVRFQGQAKSCVSPSAIFRDSSAPSAR